MLDPLTSLSLACSIVQFVDFSAKLIAGSKELYHSMNGSTEEKVDLEKITADFENLAAHLTSRTLTSVTNSIPTLSPDELAIRELAESAKSIANELLAILVDLKVGYKHQKWHSIRQAIRSACREDKIVRLKGRLDRLQSQLNSRLLATMSDQQSNIMSTLTELSSVSRRLDTNSQQNIDKMRFELISAIERNKWQPSDKALFGDLQSKMAQLENEGSRVLRETRTKILESLKFKVMRTRISDVKQAHRQTFGWAVLSPPIDNPNQGPGFMEWLQRPNDGIYWISGKAGSGKSTLMKYLHDHVLVQKSLHVWAASNNTPLTIASHFLWSAGNSVMQMSQEGLLRSLLYQVLRQHPSFIPNICSSKWDLDGKHCSTLESWTLQELRDAFQRLNLRDEISICYFIDGLDEYNGTHSEIIELLKESASSQKIKLCVSSRPWNVFEDAFGENTKLILQNFTKEDIRCYVQDLVGENILFRKFAVQDSQLLIEEIINKAQGVFLWVYLVVRSLLRGLTDENEILDLRRRLDALPADLAEYFKHMIIGIEDIYLTQSARIFQICIEAIRPPTLLTFSYLETDRADPNYAISTKIRGLSKQEIASIHSKMKKYINSRCTDLLEISFARNEFSFSFLECKVNFVHRTVRDFLKSPDVQEILRIHAGDQFDPKRYLCRALLAQVKALPLEARVRPIRGHFENMLSMADEIMFYIHVIERVEGESEVHILDELDRVNTIHAKNLNGIHWSNARATAGELFAENGACTFLALAIQARLEIYVTRKLEAQPNLLSEKRGRPLLDYALRNDFESDLQLQHQELNIVGLPVFNKPIQPQQPNSGYGRTTGHVVHKCIL